MGLLPQSTPPVIGADVLASTALASSPGLVTQIATAPLPPIPPQAAPELAPSGPQENQSLPLPPQGLSASPAPPPPPPPPPQPDSQAGGSGMNTNPPSNLPPPPPLAVNGLPPAMPWAEASPAGFGGGGQVGG